MKQKNGFSGQIGFVLAAAGSAVGVGNLWRFPYLAAKDGGGLFLIIYLVLVLTVGFTLLTTDIQDLYQIFIKQLINNYQIITGGCIIIPSNFMFGKQSKKIRNDFIDKVFNYLNDEFPNWKSNKIWKQRNFLKRMIEGSKVLTKMYCYILYTCK